MSAYDVPIGGYSLPIVFDFLNCLPQNDITYTLNVTTFTSQLIDEPTLRLLQSGTTQVQALGLKLTGGNPIVSRLQYQVKHNNVSETNPLNSFAKLQTVVSGTDSTYFGTPNVITINRVAKPTVAPNLLALAVSKAAGSVQFAFTCDQPGMVVYAFALGNTTVVGISAANISAITFNNNQRQQAPSPVDPTWLAYGYIEVAASTATSSHVHNNVRANGNYSVVAYCINQVNNASNAQSPTNWVQPDNGAKLSVVKFTFSRKLLRGEMTQIACGMVRMLAITADRVVTEMGDICQNARVLRALQNASNTTNATVTPTATVDHRFTVQPNYGAASDNTAALLTATFTASTFTTLLSRSGLTGVTISGISVNSTSIVQAPVQPTLQLTAPPVAATINSLTVTLNIANTEGYVFAAIGDSMSQVPSLIALTTNSPNSGMNSTGGNSTFLAYAYSYTAAGANTQLALTSLNANTQYQVFFAGTSLDLSPFGLATQVYRQNATTSSTTTGTNAYILSTCVMSLFAMIFSLFVLA